MREKVSHFWEPTNFKLIVIAAIFFILFDNFAFFKNLVSIYPVEPKNIIILFSIAVMFTCTTIMLFSLLFHKYTTKPILIIILLISSLVAYFMNNYSIVIDEAMIKNIIETDTSEVLDLLNVKLFIYLALVGILPSIIILKVRIKYKPFTKAVLTKITLFSCALIINLAMIFFMSDFYSSFFREHTQLRYYSNPLAYIYSVVRYLDHNLDKGTTIKIKPIGTDARISETDNDRELIILVVGETARADRFSLNGYAKETNPLLKKEDIINFPDVHSCGTSTAVCVSCMFSKYTREEYSRKKADSTYNILDVLKIAGVNILWRDNNSDSKGVALRVPFENYRTPDKNTVCNPECRDEGMLVGLQEYIDSRKTGDILIVLHQMGNHGPAYYKRYPESFEKFTPVCKTNQLEKCTSEEINNAYDNAILYTDYFLSKVITLLKQNDKFETAMFYISDHGESLGENNIYLHGMPYFMAPEEQIHIPAIMWFGDGFKIDKDNLREVAKEEHSQDYIFNTLLGIMEVKTTIYDKDRDIIDRAAGITPVKNKKSERVGLTENRK
jgi:lipid A ethanolaminephosphotransferase